MTVLKLDDFKLVSDLRWILDAGVYSTHIKSINLIELSGIEVSIRRDIEIPIYTNTKSLLKSRRLKSK